MVLLRVQDISVVLLVLVILIVSNVAAFPYSGTFGNKEEGFRRGKGSDETGLEFRGQEVALGKYFDVKGIFGGQGVSFEKQDEVRGQRLQRGLVAAGLRSLGKNGLGYFEHVDGSARHGYGVLADEDEN